jgi:hypothetical protein
MFSKFKYLCQCLGAKGFKKYSPFQWNSIHNLEGVISDAWEYTIIHVASLTIEILSFSAYEFLQVDTSTSCWKLLGVMSAIHFYAMIIHSYNRMLAKDRLLYLEKHKEESTFVLGEEATFVLRASGEYYFVANGWDRIGPLMERDKAERFCLFLKCQNELEVLEQIYLNRGKKLYSQWKATL